MENKVMILSMTKNEIIINCKKKSSHKSIIPFVIVSLFLVCFATNNTLFQSIKTDIIKVLNPVSSLYSDNSGVVFTNANAIEKDTLNLVLPIKGGIYEILMDGTIKFTVGNSIMVSACESGMVVSVNKSTDGVKCITIKHNNNLETRIENVEIVGVKENDIVKSGQDIATTKTGNTVYLKIFQNDTQISNLKISKSKIIWES